jgi:5'-nucleotidase
MSRKTVSRRELLAVSVAAGAIAALHGKPAAAAVRKKTFTILHTNDLHSSLIGVAPASDYTPFTLNDDKTRGGFARLATLIAARKKVRDDQGPVLILDAGDFSMGTAFAAAIRETGVATLPPSVIMISTSGLTARPKPLPSPPRRAIFRQSSPRIPPSRAATRR